MRLDLGPRAAAAAEEAVDTAAVADMVVVGVDTVAVADMAISAVVAETIEDGAADASSHL
jgi:hypothetical protein